MHFFICLIEWYIVQQHENLIRQDSQCEHQFQTYEYSHVDITH